MSQGRVYPVGSSPFRRFWIRHRRLFWVLHSLWALATGAVVILLARERYGFVPWVVLFLILTWASTLFFGRGIGAGGSAPGTLAAPGLREEATSYITRSMYQETLFFLLPFYAYSTVLDSLNVVFPAILAGLAVLSCLDLVFDRWLRTSPLFGLVFFAAVAFAAINLLLPVLLPIDPRVGTPLAATVAVASALPLALRGSTWNRGRRLGLALAAGLILGIATGLPRLVPPVPLRVQSATFTSGIDRDSLVPADRLSGPISSANLTGALFVIVEVFAPSIVPTQVVLEWERDGEVFRTSREIQITAHELGFRVWDGWRPETGGIPTGDYQITLRTAGSRVFGTAEITVADT